MTTSGSTVEVTVPLKENAELTQTVADAAAPVVDMAEAAIEGATQVAYTRSDGTTITAYANPAEGTNQISISTLENNLKEIAGDRTLADLVGREYSVEVTMADGSVATYTFSVTQ